jgi:hypothetical protein
MCIDMVGSPVGKIKWGEGILTSDGRHCMCSLNIACACKQLAVVVEVVCRLRLICTLSWLVAWLVRLSGEEIHPKWPISCVLAQYHLCMQTIGGGSGGGV